MCPVIVVDCGEPGTPTNGNTMGTLINITSTDVVTLALSTTFGSLVNHTCDEGFRLIGATLRECLANGNWSAPLPTCECKQLYYCLQIWYLQLMDNSDRLREPSCTRQWRYYDNNYYS